MNNDRYSKANEVVEKADIVGIIGSYIKLEKKGKDYVAICPFHNDHNPSLSVSPRLKLYNCFVCHEKGNVIHFVEKFENIPYREALRKVASTCGVEIKSNVSERDLKLEKYHKIMNDAVGLYESYLNLTSQGKEALDYLHKRNINDDVIKRFRIGLSNSDGTLITKNFLEEGKYLPIDLVNCGLIANDTNNKDRYYDLFRGRIMFPILDYRGNVIGFSGRIYNTDTGAKYMNSHEGFLFKKSSVLYNYSNAINDIKLNDRIIIFEGFMDVFAAYRAGINNSVCTMGTALTSEHVSIITNQTKNIVLCYDGDKPGIDASKRAIKMFQEAHANVRNVILPLNLDPDDYINKYGAEALRDLLLNKSVPAIDYLYEIAKRKLDINDATTVQVFIEEIKDLFNLYKSKVLEELFTKKMASDLGVDIETIKAELSKVKPTKQNDQDEEPLPADYNYDYDDIPPENYGYDVYPDNFEDDIKIVKKGTRVMQKYEKAEERLIYIALLDKNMANQIRRRLDDGEYVLRINRNILYKIYNYYNENDEMIYDDFYQKLNDDEKEKITLIREQLDSIYKVNSDDDSSIDKLYEGMDSNINCVKEVKFQKSIEDYGETTFENFEKKRAAKRNQVTVKKPYDPLSTD